MYKKYPNYWYRGDNYPNKIKLIFRPHLKNSEGKSEGKEVHLYFNLIIKDLQRTTVKTKDLITVPETPPVKESRQL
jgi:hypothetical protein